jgi:hypothetical protein
VWVAKYNSNMTLYITNDMAVKKGQVLDTITKTDPVSTWDLGSTDAQDGSNWLLIIDTTADMYIIEAA